MPFFSIIVPVYRVEQYLHQCIESVLAQTFKDYELILIDDGSPDNSPQICDEYRAEHAQIRVIHQKNKGLSAARNKGMMLAEGKYVMFLDSDDFWDDIYALDHLYKNLYDSKIDILIMNSKKFYQNINKYSAEKHHYEKVKKYGMRQLLERNLYVACAWDKIIKREFLRTNKLKFVEGQLSEDVEWCARLLLCDPQMDYINESFYCYRQQNSLSITSNVGIRNLQNIADIIIKYSFYIEYNEVLAHYLAQQYVLWLAVSNLATEPEIKELNHKMKKYWWLLKYDWYPYVKKVNTFKFVGFNGIKFLLKIYWKIKRG